MIRFTFTALLLLAVAGCKLNVIAPRGGEVQSVSSGTCVEQTVCVHDIPDATYTETFTAVPASGFAFVRWNAGGNFACANLTDPVCVVDSTVFAGILSDQDIDTFADIYIKPVFTDRRKITDIVLADGKEWAEPQLFAGVPTSEILAVCPEAAGGVCSGSLNAYSMDGWTFASGVEATSLLNSFLSVAQLGPVPASVSSEISDAYAPFDAGFEEGGDGFVVGFDGRFRYAPAVFGVGYVEWVLFGAPPAGVSTNLLNEPGDDFGALFYRMPSP